MLQGKASMTIENGNSESKIGSLRTEQVDAKYHLLDAMSVTELLQAMNESDAEVPRAIALKLPEIEKAIMKANIGFNPMNNGENIIINVPPLTEERRKALVKQCKAVGEDAKVSIRQARKDANDSIKSLQKNGLPEDTAKGGEAQSQTLTDKYVALVDKHVADKEKEVMTV